MGALCFNSRAGHVRCHPQLGRDLTAVASPPARHICRRLGTATSDACRPRRTVVEKCRMLVSPSRGFDLAEPRHGGCE